MEELEAVNMLLRAIGSSPVNSLASEQPDVTNAKNTLTRVANKIQKRGWWFNTDYNVTYQGDSNGEIILPKEIVKFVPQDGNLVKRGNRIYNNTEQTYNIGESTVAIKIVRRFEWDVLPESMQDYVAYMSAAEFVADEIEDAAKEQSFNQKAGLARIELEAEDLDSSRVNALHSNRALRARGGIFPYQRSFRGLRNNG